MKNNKVLYVAIETIMQYGVCVLFLLCGVLSFAQELRDPTTPLHQAPRSESSVELVLSAIASVGGKRFAIVNDKRVYEGDVIAGATIEKIEDGAIRYSHKGKFYTLNMRLSLLE